MRWNVTYGPSLNGSIRHDRRRGYVAIMEFDEADLNDLAAAVGEDDGFSQDCLKLALRLHELEEADGLGYPAEDGRP